MDFLNELNPVQREAVTTTQGPLLILAGAGSGKTRVITYRIAYLIKEMGVSPWNILAITFTNKAANEMKERVESLLPEQGNKVWVSTFHSMCCRILRTYGNFIGYNTNFTIFDTEDQKTLIKDIVKTRNIETNKLKEKKIIAEISSYKNKNLSWEDMYKDGNINPSLKIISEIFREYEVELKKNNAMDFDDLLIKTVELLRDNEEAREIFHNRFQYILVDEYQDTNRVQFELIKLLAKPRENICVVGDDDQSIYKFRGADIKNILSFEENFSNTKVIKLEENYRSTKNILNAANSVISNNVKRKEKKLWTSNEEGKKVGFKVFSDAYSEGEFVVGNIKDMVSLGKNSYNDFAILYRSNAQSRIFEEKLLKANIPYKIIGGINFYSRKEVKDVIAYLQAINNGDNEIAFKRIINRPKRKIGDATVDRIVNFANINNIRFIDALHRINEIDGVSRAKKSLEAFVVMLDDLIEKSRELTVDEFIKYTITKTGYLKSLEEEDTVESRARIENIDELVSKAAYFKEEALSNEKEPALSVFLEEISLISDIDSLDDTSDYVVLMTIHGSKGLEFDSVFLTGMEDGTFPSYRTICSGDEDELEEERRVCYVAITRAKKSLYITASKSRMINGEFINYPVSRFVKEIDRDIIDCSSTDINKENIDFNRPSLKKTNNLYNIKETLNKYSQKAFSSIKKDDLAYGVDDAVFHKKFGRGIVKQIVDGGRDYEVTVDFDKAGIRKLFAGFANLKKIEE